MGEATAPGTIPSASGVAARRAPPRVAVPLVSAAALGGAAYAFGQLDGSRGHAALALYSALALSVAGAAVVLITRGAREPTRGGSIGSVVADTAVGCVALLSMVASLVHFAVIDQHLEEYWLYGSFFVVVAVSQIGWSILVAARPSVAILLLGAIGNGFVSAVWVVTRTVGALIGPDATDPARAGFGDIASTLLQAAIVAGSLGIILGGRARRLPRTQAGDTAVAVIALAATAISLLALYSAVRGEPFVSHVG